MQRSKKNKFGFTPLETIRRQKEDMMSLTGFTLIETLIVTVMISVVALAIFTTLNNGIRIWQRLNQEVIQEDIGIFFAKIADDLRNAFKFNEIKFIGTEDKIAFATFVFTRGWTETLGRCIGQVAYQYDNTTKTLKREERDYSQIYLEDNGTEQGLLKNIESLKFSYYFYNDEKKEYIWQEEWQQEGLPLAVRIELEFSDGSQIQKINQIISIPVAQS